MPKCQRFLTLCLFICASLPWARAIDPLVDQALESTSNYEGKVYRDLVRARWLPDQHRFWYSVKTGPDSTEYVLVDAETGKLQRTDDLTKLGLPKAEPSLTSKLPLKARPSRYTNNAINLELVNTLDRALALYWIDADGRRQDYGRIEPGTHRYQHTYESNSWLITELDGTPFAAFVAQDTNQTIQIDGPGHEDDSARHRARTPAGQSPDKQWEVRLENNNVTLVHVADGKATPLTTDGTDEIPYLGPVCWAPDSSRFTLTQTKLIPERIVTIIDSSPDDQLQPKKLEIPYAKPGDPIAQPRPVLFKLINGTASAPIKVETTLFPNGFYFGPEIEFTWANDSRECYFDYNQRGHQLYRVLALDGNTGAVRTVIEERNDKFIDYTNKTWRHWLPGNHEVLWTSERDGWNHLWLYDADSGQPIRQITRGSWVVRSIDHVDDDQRQVWFMASGINPAEDPYYLHLCRVNFDGTGFIQLTPDDGTHRIKWSPDRRWFVDTYSRVDLPPMTDLRRSDDGAFVTHLETAQIKDLLSAGWSKPERFTAKGRDGKTDIYGVIVKPADFDPNKKYPVVEEVYAGPQDSFAPKSFNLLSRQHSIANLGFIVVQADGMGTNNRGREFHQVCWKNLKDAGFPDRIAWIKAAAQDRPWMDLSHVGIYGTSAGGQSAMRALLDYNDFYSVAVADSGCHDNRMDKIWWNEQWMGWPVDESYAKSSNTEDAAKLKGHLMLVVGELDTNVDPATTSQVVDRLIKAGKDFDYLFVPGAGHGAVETPYGKRRRLQFLYDHLIKENR